MSSPKTTTVFLAIAGMMCAVDPAHARAEDETGPHADDDAMEEVVVYSTRFDRRVQDEPTRVEVISEEEIAEKLMMTPGSIAMLVAETGGVRVQVTSPAMGTSNIRMQGMNGRYTQILADGLPLYGGQTSSLGLLQIPPTDLGQVEVIKGAASALYGPSALGGIVNLISRRPGEEAEGQFLLNATTRDGQDLTAYVAAPIDDAWRYSLTAGMHRQSRHDLDDDGWVDMPGYELATFRPRIYWEGEGGATAFITLGAMTEDRVGGTLPGRNAPDGTPFPQRQDSRRYDGGLIAKLPGRGDGEWQFRASAMSQNHEHAFGSSVEGDRHRAGFGEVTYATELAGTSLLAGVAMQSDTFRSEAFPQFDYTFDAPAVFAQMERKLRDDISLAASARWDSHSQYGSHVSPRVSLLYRPGAWTVRTSVGTGFYAPTPFVEEVEAAGLSRIAIPGILKRERATTASLDVGYAAGPLESSVTLFASEVDDPVRLDGVGLVNDDEPVRTRGAEFLLRYRWDDFSTTASYLLVDSDEGLTPRHAAGLVSMWEKHDVGRVGLEVYYTGRQRLDDNPYRTSSRHYFEVGLLGEVILGKVSLYLNLENILDFRQTDHDPLLRSSRAADGRWTVDVWGPTDGFVVNGGIRLTM